MLCCFFVLLADHGRRVVLNTVVLRGIVATSPARRQKDPSTNGSYLIRLYVHVVKERVSV